MDDKKKIGDFFNEGIQNASFEPNADMWPRISKTLKKKKKRRFFWFTLASLIFVSLTTYLLFYQINLKYQNSNPVKTKVSSKTKSEIKKKKNFYPSTNKQSNIIKDSSYLSEKSSSNKIENLQNKNSSNTFNQTKTSIFSKKYNNTNGKDEITTSNSTKNTKSKSSITSKLNNTFLDTISVAENNNSIKSLIDKKSNDTIIKKKKDSTKTKKKRAKKIESILKKEEDIITKDTTLLSKLDVSVHFSPIVSRYLTDRNLLLPESQITNKQVRLSYSYRLLLTIPIKEKIDFRFGVAHQEFRYNVQFIPNASAINNYGGIITSNIAFPLSQLTENISNDLASNLPIDLEHKIRYLQIPFELNYKLKEDKIGVDLITGLDFFVLQDDDVFIKSPSTEDFFVGRTNFLTAFSIALHGGVGFEYKLSEKLKFQIEPTIIYQIGGYKNDVKNPNPIYLSLYSGFNFRF